MNNPWSSSRDSAEQQLKQALEQAWAEYKQATQAEKPSARKRYVAALSEFAKLIAPSIRPATQRTGFSQPVAGFRPLPLGRLAAAAQRPYAYASVPPCLPSEDRSTSHT